MGWMSRAYCMRSADLAANWADDLSGVRARTPKMHAGSSKQRKTRSMTTLQTLVDRMRAGR